MSDNEDAREEEERDPTPPPPPKKEPEEAPKPKPKPPPVADPPTGGKTEAELMMEDKLRRDKIKIEEEIEEYKAQRAEELVMMNADISELTEKIARRKVEREEEERRLAEAGIVEQQRRKAEEDERQKKKKDAEEAKHEKREQERIEAEDRASQMGKRSFVITRKNKDGDAPVEEVRKSEESVKSKEQLEAEKKAILEQRITPLGDLNSLADAALKDKAKELHGILFRLESDKYDLEQHFKQRQYEMMELADRARQMNKGKKKFNVAQDADPMGEKYSGIPPKISLCSKYERHKDRRTYVERKDVFGGPIYAEDVARILPTWEQEGGTGERPQPAAEEEED